MNRRTLLIISLLIIICFITVGIALANERVKVIEMGESGQIVEFPMSPEEMASEDKETARLAAIRQAKLERPKERMQVIEMGESGQIVSFLMTPEEMAAEDAEKLRLSELHRKSSVDDRQTIVYELAESGILIEFTESIFEVHTVNIAKMENQ